MKTKQNISILLTIIFCSIILFGQKTTPKTQPNEPVLIPLTEEEKKIDVKDLLVNQPSYTATQNFFFSEGFGGFSASEKIASKGNFYRIDTGMVIVVSEIGKPDIRIYRNKTFEREVWNSKVFITPSVGLNPKDLLSFDDISFSALGSIEIDGHKCLKIEAKSKSISPKVFLYAAKDLKNLIIAAQVLAEKQGSVQRLVNISFDVPDSLFQIPSGYRELPKHKWTKVDTAKVYKNDKLLSGAIIFRHDDFIFLHIEEFEDYLIDLKNKKSGISFQGLLVASNGRYIWKTEENEAISSGDLVVNKNDCKKCPAIVVGSNFVTFPNSMYDYSKIIYKLTW